MLKTLLKLVLFGGACFLAVEQSYRFIAVGPDAFSPVKFNSYNQLVLTDFVELSPYPEVYYQLRPNLDTWFRGKRFRTNSRGLADQEYSVEKDEDVFRVVVVGSSWTMATGVEPEEAWHAVLEEQLNAEYPGQRFEFVNFAVEYYGLRELVGTVRHRALDWQPDLIHVDLTSFTCYLLWEPPPPVQQLPEQTTPMLQSYFLREVDSALKLGVFPTEVAERPTVGLDMELNDRQVLRALQEIQEMAEAVDIPVTFSWLSFSLPGRKLSQNMQELADKRSMTYIRAYEVLTGEGAARRQISAADKHPNAYSHQLIAERVRRDLSNSNLLPVSE